MKFLVFVSLAFCAFFFEAVEGEFTCPENWMKGNYTASESCYWMVADAHVNVYEASAICVNNTAFLLTIETKEENGWLDEFIPAGSIVWTSGYWRLSYWGKGFWNWWTPSGNEYLATFQNWADGEPNESDKDDVGIVVGGNGYWYEVPGINKFGYICKRSISGRNPHSHS